MELNKLEEVLITSDVGVETTLKIIGRIEERVAKDKYINTSDLNNILKSEISMMLRCAAQRSTRTDSMSVERPLVAGEG